MDPAPPGLGPLVECSSYVRVSNLQPGVTVNLTSDQKDSPQLAPKNLIAHGPVLDIGPTYRPLRALEMVTATVSPCGSGHSSSTTSQVKPLTSLAPPKVYDPAYAFQTTVQVDNCVPGAQVHLFVNGAYRNMATAAAPSVQIPCGDLNPGDRLRALQALCQLISGLSEPIVQVMPGEMAIGQSPNPVITGANPQQVTVTATISAKPQSNPYNGQAADADVIDVNTKQKIGETNKPITRNFPYFYDGSKHPYIVSAPKFKVGGPLKFLTQDPAPKADFAMSPPNPQYANQPVYFIDTSSGAIQKWQWDFTGGPNIGSPSFIRNPAVKFSHTYTPITVKLTVTGPSGSASKAKTFGTLVPPNNMQNQYVQCETVQIVYCPNDLNTPNTGDHATLSIYAENKTKGTGPGQPTTLGNGYVGGAYGYAGVCGWGQGSPSITITLEDNSLMHIWGVDNNNAQRGEAWLWGKKGAGTLLWGID
jgi:PKD repeat protein